MDVFKMFEFSWKHPSIKYFSTFGVEVELF